MKIWNETLTLQTRQLREFVDLAPQIRAAVEKSGIRDGLVAVNSLHANAGILVTCESSDLLEDLQAWLEKIAPAGASYRHQKQESSADVHMRALLVNQQAVLSLTGGKIDLGPWQTVYFAEFDGQRPKRVLVKIVGE